MKHQEIIDEVNKVIIGKENQINKIMMTILAKGHILLEDLPGVGKTTLANAFSKALGLDSKRIQFTPDVLPSDIVGFNSIDDNGEIRLHKGAAFTNLFLADEINRTSSRTQSALLEVMEENQITVDGVTHPALCPFHVIATQNPFGSAGTQMLPDSQMDRFMITLSLGYPDETSEVEMLKRKQNPDSYTVQNIVSIDDLIEMQKEVEMVFVHDDIMKYVVSIVSQTRNHEAILQGGSPRASISLINMAKACAYINNRDYVLPRDIHEIYLEVMMHRIILKNKADNNQQQAKRALLKEILETVPAPTLSR